MHTIHWSSRSAIGLAAALALVIIAPQTVLAGDATGTAYGAGALNSDAGSDNSAFGYGTLQVNGTGSFNTAAGTNALNENDEGDDNTAIGINALGSNDKGSENTASGNAALISNHSGNQNTANGSNSLLSNTSGWGNTASGYQALYNNISGHNNIGLGYGAGSNLKGSNNIAIQNAGVSSDNNTIRIGTAITRTFISGIYGVTASQGVQACITSDGQFYMMTSPQQLTKDIKPVNGVSDKLLQLRPVSFIYKEDESNQTQFGLIAEEVAKVYPELVQYDQEGKPFTVYYSLLTPLLISELQKEHAKIATQKTQLADVQAIAAQQQAKLDSRERQLIAQRAEMLALLQQQQQQDDAEMAVLQQKVSQLDELLQASNSSQRASARVAMVPAR